MTTYAVTCRIGMDINHRTPFKTREAAQRHLELVEKGGHCSLEHKIEEVPRGDRTPS